MEGSGNRRDQDMGGQENGLQRLRSEVDRYSRKSRNGSKARAE